jgi:hypothetical protein
MAMAKMIMAAIRIATRANFGINLLGPFLFGAWLHQPVTERKKAYRRLGLAEIRAAMDSGGDFALACEVESDCIF